MRPLASGRQVVPMTAEAASPAPLMSLKELYRLYTSLAAKPGTPVPLSAFELSRAATGEEVKSRARELRITCDTCHALYLEDQ